jgi:hypothetical protein
MDELTRVVYTVQELLLWLREQQQCPEDERWVTVPTCAEAALKEIIARCQAEHQSALTVERLRGLIGPMAVALGPGGLDRVYAMALDEFAAALRAGPNHLPPPADHADGPAPPNLFWWQRQRHELAPRLWQMLSAIWGRDTIPIEEVRQRVWGDEGEDVEDSTIRSTLSDLNARLDTIGVPWAYHLRRGYITRD